jgi:hypothetical protein
MKNMMNKITVPKDVQAICEQVARGYERRKKEFARRRADIIYRGIGVSCEGRVGSGAGRISDPCAVKAEQLEKLDGSLNARLIRAVDESLVMLTASFPRDSGEKLCKAILLNCEDSREHPYEFLGLDEVSRTEFYRRKKKFIKCIGVVLGLVDG